MDLSALQRTINALEKSLDSLGGWLAFFTALVVVGLIVEYAEDLKNLVTERPFNWRLFRTMVGGFLITAGVAGELLIQFRASKVETDLRSANHKIEAMLNKEASDANERAANIEQRLADRHITVEQREKMLKILRVRPGTNVRVDWLLSSASSDALRYAREIADVFHDARWNVVYPMSLTSSERPQVGVSIEIKSDSSSNRELRALVMKAFKAAGIPASKGIDPNLISPSVIEVLVGSK